MVINKKKYDAKDLVFEDSAVTYDGKGHSIKAENVPSGVSVEYSVEKESLSGKTPVDGVEATDAGTYIYTAEFHSLNSNYEDLPSAEAKLTITPAKYDTSDIILESAEIVYDGKPHSLSYRLAEGLTKLPESFDSYGWYEKNGKILYENDDENGEYVSEVSESGTYAYTLIFIDENGNYEIPELTACLVIDKIDYDVSRVAVEDYAYTGNLIGVQVNGVPEGLGVELYYFRSDDIPACDENGNYTNCIKDDVTGKSGVTDAGEYRVLVKFTGQDNVNYNYLQPKMLTFCVYEVTEAD